MKELKLEIMQMQNVVVVKILQQDESTRSIDEPIEVFVASNGFRMASCRCPEIKNNYSIFLRGSAKSKDELLTSTNFSTVECATKFKKDLEKCVKEYNESIKNNCPFMEDEKCYYITDWGVIDCEEWIGDDFDTFRLNSNNCFKTQEEAVRKLEILNFIHEHQTIFTNEEWEDLLTTKYYIYCNRRNNELKVTDTSLCHYATYYFRDKETTQKVLDFIGIDDYIKYVLNERG